MELGIYKLFSKWPNDIPGEQGLSQDFHNRVSKLGFQEFRVSRIPD